MAEQQQETVSTPPPERERKDFFISYTGKDSYWAQWIAWQLEGLCCKKKADLIK